jgi:hypothetical protein
MTGSTHPAEAALTRDPDLREDPIAFELAHVLAVPTGTSSKGFPFLEQGAYQRFRERVPHILAMGPRTLHALDRVVAVAKRHGLDVGNAAKVVRGCVLTAAITAPADLWLLRYVLGTLGKVGLTASSSPTSPLCCREGSSSKTRPGASCERGTRTRRVRSAPSWRRRPGAPRCRACGRGPSRGSRSTAPKRRS